MESNVESPNVAAIEEPPSEVRFRAAEPPQEPDNSQAFTAIVNFVSDLFGANPNKKELALYNRLLEKIVTGTAGGGLGKNTGAMERHIACFRTFFAENPDFPATKIVAPGSKIVYTPNHVFINISDIINESNTATVDIINAHLLTIYSLINIGTEAGSQALTALSAASEAASGANADPAAGQSMADALEMPDTAEGQFLKTTLNQMTQQIGNLEETSNPMALVGTMMSNGFFTNFVGQLTTKFESGEMTLPGLMQTTFSMLQKVAPAGQGGTEFQTMLSASMSQLGSMAAEGNTNSAGAEPNLFQQTQGHSVQQTKSDKKKKGHKK